MTELTQPQGHSTQDRTNKDADRLAWEREFDCKTNEIMDDD
jgi:hypothetical protein